jgi:hypothetical protein
MPILADKDLETIQFFEDHLPIWQVTPAAVGLSAPQCVLLTTLTKNARDAYVAAQKARLGSKAATSAYHDNTMLMRDLGADMIRLIKAFADASANPGTVYNAAQIPLPLPPSPPVVPGTPEMVTVGLNPGGSLTLRWKAKNAAPSSGAVFDVTRRIDNTGQYMSIGPGKSVKGGKFEFTDSTLVNGTQSASYIIVGKRDNPPQTGIPCEAVNVQFGISAGGGMTIMNANGATFKMAA